MSVYIRNYSLPHSYLELLYSSVGADLFVGARFELATPSEPSQTTNTTCKDASYERSEAPQHTSSPWIHSEWISLSLRLLE